MPEGVYTFCWEVYDAFTNEQLNHPTLGCSNIYLLLNDPPFLNVPYKGDQVVAQDPMNIIFQWTPRHANASNVSYEFELRELWDTQIAPEAAFLTSPNYYTETTATTRLLYHIGKPTLLPNKRYGWRVRAVSRTGLSKHSVFKNDGYSEIYYFTYNTACYPPRYVLSEAVGKAGVQIRWQGMPEHKRYHVQYKRADIPDAEWFEVYTYNTQVQISNLRAGKTYVFRVGGSCNELNDLNPLYAYSAINEFSLPAKNEKSSSYTCGIVPEIEISNTQPLQNIGINETFTAGDFPVTIKQVSGSNGRFRGVGYIVVPYLADTKLAVSFTNIRINTDYQLIEGVVSTTYDATWGDVESVDDMVDDISDLVDTIYDTIEDALEDLGIIAGDYEEETLGFVIEEIKVNENGETVIIGTNGEEQNLGLGNNTVVKDENGKTIVVNKNGETGEVKNTNAIENQILVTNIKFKKHSKEIGSFDDNLIDDYPHYEKRFNKSIIWKSLKSGVIDKLTIEIDTIQNNIFLEEDSNLSFITPKQIVKNTEEISLTSSYNKKEMVVHVRKDSIKGDSIALFKVISYPKKIINLKLITLDEENDDVQVYSLNNKVESDTTKVVSWGKNSFLDTKPQGDDYVKTTLAGEKYIVAGANKICETISRNTNLKTISPYFSLSEIKDYLNKKIYNQANVELNITMTIDTLNFDKNNDGKIDVSNNRRSRNNVNDEYNVLIKEYSNNSEYVIVLVDNPDDGSLGWFPSTTNVGVVHVNTHIKTTKKHQLMNTIAHELGHGGFGLQHPFDEFSNYNQGKDPKNIMDYQDGDLLRKYQWDLIQKK
ncbi:hypothetical protein TFA04_110001 [Tenacibaculum maritimum]|nr:hypothetical protein TFA04_110001 [Tenacibaculum maritimum]